MNLRKRFKIRTTVYFDRFGWSLSRNPKTCPIKWGSAQCRRLLDKDTIVSIEKSLGGTCNNKTLYTLSFWPE